MKENNFQKNTQLLNELEEHGWHVTSMGQYRSNGTIKEFDEFTLFMRITNFDDFLKNVASDDAQKRLKSRINAELLSTGSKDPVGDPHFNMTLSGKNNADDRNSSQLPELAAFNAYPSLVNIRPDKPCLLIGYDSEWDNLDYGREMLSWQCSAIWDNKLYEFCFIKNGYKNLSLITMLGCVLDKLGLKPIDVRKMRRYDYCYDWVDGKPVIKTTSDYNEARKNSLYVYQNGRFICKRIDDMDTSNILSGERADWVPFKCYYDNKVVDKISVTLLSHCGLVDISGLDYDEVGLKWLTEVQGGLVSLKPKVFNVKSIKKAYNTYVYPVSLSVADTMCHAPAKKKRLEDLGETIGVNKIDIPDTVKGNMGYFLEEDLLGFLEYASRDSVVTLLYASALYGYNNSLPVTITSATASVMKQTMMDYLGCNNTVDFDLKYRGLQKVSHGLVPKENRPGFVEATSLEPISDIVNTIQHYASHAYHGGYNSCSEVGYFPDITFDYDLKNAYPTAMCLVPDIDWANPVKNEIIRRPLDLNDWSCIGGFNPLLPFIGYVRFEFPEKVKFPCIPVNVEGVPIYPRTSEGLDGVYVAGPYIYLALMLGAKIYCERGYFLNTLYNQELSHESRSLACAVKQLVVDRNKTVTDCGKGSLEELILKTMVSSGYGKNAQNVVDKSSWSAYTGTMEHLGCSAITNPLSAMMVTSIVQVELLATQNQLNELGYLTCSVTTDGFISNVPIDILKSLDLFGVRPFMEQARLFLTDGQNPEIWEMKHAQDDLINFTTRGNVSLYCKPNQMVVDCKELDGVCAHNSVKSGFASDTYEDRLWLMQAVLNRDDAVEYTTLEFSNLKELVKGNDFCNKNVTRHIRMDFDMKRKPDRKTFKTDYPVVDGIKYEIAHFDTVPFENVEEFLLYRRKKELTKVLRTEADWEIFWNKIFLRDSRAKVRDMEWAIINSCIMGHRMEMWTIPALLSGSVDEKCEWINSHNTSSKKFKKSDWENARRPERQCNLLPIELIQDKLDELMCD